MGLIQDFKEIKCVLFSDLAILMNYQTIYWMGITSDNPDYVHQNNSKLLKLLNFCGPIGFYPKCQIIARCNFAVHLLKFPISLLFQISPWSLQGRISAQEPLEGYQRALLAQWATKFSSRDSSVSSDTANSEPLRYPLTNKSVSEFCMILLEKKLF